jgi:hypothetical protein
MDTTHHYRTIVQQVIQAYASHGSPKESSQTEMVFDHERGRYLLLEVGWQRGERVYMTLMHLDVVDGKIWIQDDGTEEGVSEFIDGSRGSQRTHRSGLLPRKPSGAYRVRCGVICFKNAHPTLRRRRHASSP